MSRRLRGRRDGGERAFTADPGHGLCNGGQGPGAARALCWPSPPHHIPAGCRTRARQQEPERARWAPGHPPGHLPTPVCQLHPAQRQPGPPPSRRRHYKTRQGHPRKYVQPRCVEARPGRSRSHPHAEGGGPLESFTQGRLPCPPAHGQPRSRPLPYDGICAERSVSEQVDDPVQVKPALGCRIWSVDEGKDGRGVVEAERYGQATEIGLLVAEGRQFPSALRGGGIHRERCPVPLGLA